MSTETMLWITVVALIVWNGFQQSLLGIHQKHLGANDKRMDAHQRHLAAHDVALRLRSITPLPARTLNRFEDAMEQMDRKIHELEKDS